MWYAPTISALHNRIKISIVKLLLTVVVSICCLLFTTSQSTAQTCTFTSSGLDFGTIDLSGGSFFQTTGTFTSNCTGTPGLKIRICANFGVGSGGLSGDGDPRHLVSGANQLDYNIFRKSNYFTIWGSKVWAFSPTHWPKKLTLNGSGNASHSKVVRGEIYSGQSGTTPGLYSSSFSGNHTLIAYAYTSVGNCATISGGAGIHVQVPFSVVAVVNPSCTVSATTMNFGSVGFLSANRDTSNTISVNCSNLIPYTISLGDGLNGIGDPTSRKMNNGGTLVDYGIYQDSGRSTPWGDSIGTNTVSDSGTGSTQNFTAYGRVPTQTTPVPGTYSDTIVMTVTY